MPNPTRLALAATLGASALAAPAFGQYRVLVTQPQVSPDAARLTGFTAAGSSVFAAYSGPTSTPVASRPYGIARVDGAGSGASSSTNLVNRAQFTAAAGGGTVNALTPGFSLSPVGGSIQFGDSTTDQVYRVGATPGSISVYTSNASIPVAAAGDTASLLLSGTTAPDGEFTFYEATDDNILKTAGPNATTTLTTAAQLTDATTSSVVTSGFAYSGGSLFFGSNNSDSVLAVGPGGGTPTEAITTAQLTTFTGETSAGFGDFAAGPGGRVYFYESSDDSILSFDPALGAASLRFELTEAQLLAGPAGTDLIGEIDFFGGNLAFLPTNGTAVYVVPEPASLATVGLIAGAALLRRRRA